MKVVRFDQVPMTFADADVIVIVERILDLVCIFGSCFPGHDQRIEYVVACLVGCTCVLAVQETFEVLALILGRIVWYHYFEGHHRVRALRRRSDHELQILRSVLECNGFLVSVKGSERRQKSLIRRNEWIVLEFEERNRPDAIVVIVVVVIVVVVVVLRVRRARLRCANAGVTE